MGGIDLLLAAVFASLTVLMVVDRRLAMTMPGVPAVATEPDHAPARGLAGPAASLDGAGIGLSQLGAHTEGWALMGPSGTVVATNLPERAALLAGACAVLRLAGDSAVDAHLQPWHTVTLEGPRGFLLGQMSPRGAVLAVLARRDADRGDLRQAMRSALLEVEHRWDELVSPAPQPLPERVVPATLAAEAATFSPYTPLD